MVVLAHLVNVIGQDCRVPCCDQSLPRRIVRPAYDSVFVACTFDGTCAGYGTVTAIVRYNEFLAVSVRIRLLVCTSLYLDIAA